MTDEQVIYIYQGTDKTFLMTDEQVIYIYQLDR